MAIVSLGNPVISCIRVYTILPLLTWNYNFLPSETASSVRKASIDQIKAQGGFYLDLKNKRLRLAGFGWGAG